MERLWDAWDLALCFLNLVIQNAGLEVHHWKKQAVSINVQVLVNKIETVLLAIVAEEVLLFVCVAKLHDLATNEVADAASNVDECEAICRNPQAGLYSLVVLIHEVKSFFESIVHIFLLQETLGNGLVNNCTIELKQVECVFESQCDFAVIFRPEYVLQVWGKIYSPHDIIGLPVIESNILLASKG